MVVRVSRGRGFGFRVGIGEEAGEAGGAVVSVAEAGISLAAATGGLVEEGAVNLGYDDVV